MHKGFRTLDTVPHVLTSARIVDAGVVRIVTAADLPNPNWMRPGVPGTGQMAFGNALLKAHMFVLIPSVVPARGWNVIFDPAAAKYGYDSVAREPFALDTRSHPP